MPELPEIPIDRIHANPINPRKLIDEGQLEELAQSIAAQGVLQPIVLRPHPKKKDAYELVIGERRWRAAKRAGLEAIPAQVREIDDHACLEIMLIENGRRADLDPLEEAETFRLLKEKYATSPEEIAKKTGKSRSAVYQRLQLVNLHDRVKKSLAEGQITVSVAELLARAVPVAQQPQALDDVGPDRWGRTALSYREAKKVVERNYVLRLSAAPWSLGDLELLPKAGACTACPMRSGNQPALFENGSAKDLCLHPKCFAAKRTAYRKRTLEAAAAKGSEVLEGDDAAKVVDRHGHVKHGSPFVALDEDPPGQPWDKPRKSYRRFLGKKNLPPITVVARPDSDELVELVRKSDVAKIFKAKGIKVRGDRQPTSRSKTEAAQRREVRLRQAAHDEVIAALVSKIESAKPATGAASTAIRDDVLRLLAVEVIESVWSDATETTASRRGLPKGSGYGRGAAVKPLAKKAKPREVLALLLEVVAHRHRPGAGRRALSKRVVDLAKACGVDARGVERRAGAYVRAIEKRRAGASKKKGRRAGATRKATPARAKKGTRKKKAAARGRSRRG